MYFDIKIVSRVNGHYSLYNKTKKNIFQRVKQVLCDHSWDKVNGQSGYFNGGKEYFSKHSRCIFCDLYLSENVMIKDHYLEEEIMENIIERVEFLESSLEKSTEKDVELATLKWALSQLSK